MGDILSDLFDEPDFDANHNFAGAPSPVNLFSILDTLEPILTPPENLIEEAFSSQKQEDPSPISRRSRSRMACFDAGETDVETSPCFKKIKLSSGGVSHITVERNRRKQMNEHLSVLRSLMPCFYVKRGDQASIIEGVVEFIKESQQVLQSLEAKKQRKVYGEVLSPRPVSSPRLPPISPRTPQPKSPYKPRMQHSYLSPTIASSHEPSSSFGNGGVKELAAESNSPVADVEVKFSGTNVLLKTISRWIPGQSLKIIIALEGLSLEILEAKISMHDNSMINSFTIKIGIGCSLSVEELAQEIQQTFC